MEEIRLDRAIALLSSEKLKDRNDALADLKHILQRNKQSSKLHTVDDKACHKIFESLFRFVAVERTLYNRASSKGASSTRLSTCASVLRLAVDVFLRNFRYKTLRAIIDHVTETLPTPEEGLWEPLSAGYTKCLVALLRYPPHIEHLSSSEWGKLMNFCLRSLGVAGDDSQTSFQDSSRSSLHDHLDVSGRSTPSRPASSLAIRDKYTGNKSVIGEIILCIQLLTASPNAPVQASAEKILHGLAEYVKPSPVAGSGQQAAFSSINSVVTRVLFDQSDLVQGFLFDLIPVIRRLWNTKLAGLRDELLGTIMLCTVVLTDAARREPSESLFHLIESLMSTLYSEYIKRPEKEILQIDELAFNHKRSTNIDRVITGPLLGNAKSEHNWTLVWAISCLLKLLEDIAARLSTSQVRHEGVPNKKQRLASEIGDVLRDSFSSLGTKRICALQLIPILIEGQADIDTKVILLQKLTPSILDDNGTISSWTMVAIASIASSPDAKSPSLNKHWHQVWDLASRASTSQSTSRASCNLMNIILQFDLLEYSIMAEKIRSMLSSVNLSGASTLTDSSLAFWAVITRMGAQVNPGTMLNVSKQVCAWLREAWTIGTVTDRIQTAQVAAFARPLDLLNLLLACANRPFELPHFPFRGPTGLIAKHWHFFHSNRKLLNYLFDLQGAMHPVNPWAIAETLSLEQSTRQDPNDAVVLDLLQVKSEMFLQTWQSLSEEKSHHITVDVLQILVSFCIMVALYVEFLPSQAASRLQVLRQNSHTLWNNICSFLARGESTLIGVCLEPLSVLMDSITCFFNPQSMVSRALNSLVPPISAILETQRRSQSELLRANDDGAMDLDDTLSSADESSVVIDQIKMLNREALPLFFDPASFQRCMAIRLSIFQKGTADTYQSGRFVANTDLVGYLTQLDEVDYLAAHHFMPDIYQACASMDRDTLLEILEDIGEKCLPRYELERCESFHSLCIRMMASWVSSWTNMQDDTLNESASDMYTWFMEVLVARRKASPRVHVALSDLLGAVISSNPTYMNDQSSPSPRTSLLTILREGDAPVKFSAANLLPRLFGQFPLKDHDAIFDDVLESLPRDPDWDEGIALRLYILAQLASQWHTLLRRSIYHMFETPAQVPHSLWYAEKCLCEVAKTLGLEDARELFRLFSSQILYTWTESQSIKSMPFSLFGYTSLSDMLKDVQDEVVGQIMMRANGDEATELSECVNTPFEKLLEESFYKAEAYSIARDISIPPGQGHHPKGVETGVKKALGTDSFVKLVEKQFPSVIATFFKTLDHYGQIERAFSKRENFQGALDILQHITAKSSSVTTLPANQQPSFKARYLLDELEFLCKRSGYEFETIWTPTLVTFVGRTLIESIQPALGSLHACSVIRKIRILVCVAGPVMLQDYPYEMMIHALQPLLTDIYCTEDALGIFWYLLETGEPYMTENPCFVAEVAVSTFASLKKFLESSPDSTAQENQFRIALTKIRGFLKWFIGFLDGYSSPALDAERKEAFGRLLKSSQHISKAGASTNGAKAKEHELLLEILRDQNAGKSLLSKPISDHVVSLLCADSKVLPDYRSAIIGNANDPVASITAIYKTLQNFKPGPEYRLWAARVIGGAFATTGKISDALSREQDPSLFDVHELPPMDDWCTSKARIIRVLCKMLQSSSHLEVGLVERTLQLIVSGIQETQEFNGCAAVIPLSLMNSLIWSPYHCPSLPLPTFEENWLEQQTSWPGISADGFARQIALFLSKSAPRNPVIGPLQKVLNEIPGLAAQLLPFIIHDILLSGFHGEARVRDSLSNVLKEALYGVKNSTIPHVRLVIDCLLYLRDQPRPRETKIVDRDEWLDIDYGEASAAANICHLPKTSLLFLEIHASRVLTSARRSSLAKYEPPSDLLHDIFKEIDDPDLYYGIQKKASLDSVMETLEYKSSSFKNLLFQSAQYDSEIQMGDGSSRYGILKALNSTNLQGIANSMVSVLGDTNDASGSFDSMLQSATSLRQWDIPVSPVNSSPAATVFKVFQSLNTSEILPEVSTCLDDCLLSTLDSLTRTDRSATSLRTATRVLGILTEVNDVVSARSIEEVNQGSLDIMTRNSWLKTTNVHEIGEILSYHEALFSSIKQKNYLKSAMNLRDDDAQLLEVKVIRRSLEISRNHDMPQASLKSAICLSKLAQACSSKGINIEGAAKFDLANVLWDQGEMTTSIRMLQQLSGQKHLHKQAVPISRAELLVTLGHHVAEARLEVPEVIIQEYLDPAVKELKDRSEGEDAGRVYHGFAMFCDQQLQNPDGLEDFNRVEQIRNRKERELDALESLLKKAQGRERENLKNHRAKAKQWFDLDDMEYQRHRESREAFMQQCLENYLLCLRESETYNNDILRFCALWLDNSDSQVANQAVSQYLNEVPSRKFAPLMNQLTSRLLDITDDFQNLLTKLIYRICAEHPYHGMYQIFASSKSKGGKDEVSLSRHRAAVRLVDSLKSDKGIGSTWVAIHNHNIDYVRFAIDRVNERYKSGAKIPLRKLPTGQRLEDDAALQKLPPPTMNIDLRVDGNYTNVPKLAKFLPEFTLASGVSAPKIVTAIATNGLKYKQLFKGGNDDLRQDAIMEQVFGQVSSLLKDHRATRQRNLVIRTYKVLPLTSNAGIIEFVPNTIPLHDYILPAHQRYYPKDMKPSTCRKHISDVQTRNNETRVRTYNQVAESFRPVMRYFFMERYNNPDDWFDKRLAYTRSTAAISILGHVLGLGDRHGHNILMDEQTGEVVHIDLGVAFEQGRILPIPEVVPFRLTRDLVDGMGITKTEGVFRRCCEFTLETLRQESYSIMTILDVLRYDPLYSWSLSPLRMKKMQDQQEAGDAPQLLVAGDQRADNEPSEADRALKVVEKKLSKTLSVTATVNELIQQATDEKNLAVLYSGWAAYA